MQQPPQLPLELILQVVEASFPPGGPNLIADVATDEAQQLVTWTHVCRATYEPATRFLRQHCVYIDSYERLRTYFRCLLLSSRWAPTSTLPPTVPMANASSIYIGLDMETIKNPDVATIIKEWFVQFGSSITRLILDLPFRRISEYDYDPLIEDELFEALGALTNMEEFVTTGGIPALDFWRRDADIAQRWPKLRRLAGFQINLADEGLWWNVSRSRTIEEVVIARPYLLRIQKWNVKRAVSEHWQQKSGGDASYARRLRIALIDHEFSPSLLDTEDWALHDPSELMNVSRLDVPVVALNIKRTDYACKEFLMKAARGDTLWTQG